MQWTLHRRTSTSIKYPHLLPRLNCHMPNTWLTLGGYKGNHTCFLCEQNKVGHLKSKVKGRESQVKILVSNLN